MIDDLEGPQFCEDRGYCICGNDCMNPNPDMSQYDYPEPMICPICQKPFQSYEGMREDIRGVNWCKPCTDEHDAIDWEEVAEKRMGM